MKPSPGVPRRWRRTLVAVGIASLTALAAVPARAATSGARGKPDLSGVTLRVGYGAVRDTSSQDLRMASGAFDDTPYEIKWVSFPSGSQTLEAMNAGAIDITPDSQATAVILAQAGAKAPWTRASAPFRVVSAAVPPADAGVVIGVRPGSGIRKIRDLKGKKVTYVRGGPSQLYWAIAAKEAKLKDGDVETVELPQGEGRAAFLSGAVDALVAVNRTFTPLVREKQAEILAKSNGVAPEYRMGVARAGFLDDKANRAAVTDFIARIAKSKRWIVKHPDDAAAVYARAAKVELPDALAAVHELPTKVLPLDAAFADAVQQQAKIFYVDGVTASNPKIAILFDPRFVLPTDTAE